MSSKPFAIDYDKRGVAKCKKCKEKLDKGLLRIAKVVSNPFTEDGGDMKQWFHINCLFESFKKARATTKKVEDPVDDIEGWQEVTQDDKDLIKQKIKEYFSLKEKDDRRKYSVSPKKRMNMDSSSSCSSYGQVLEAAKPSGSFSKHNDNSFKEFRKLCANIAGESSYLSKTEIVSTFFQNGTDGESFKGDLKLWVRLLIPGVVKRVYNIQSRQMTKLFSQLFGTSQEEMLIDLEKGDIAETVKVFFEASTVLRPSKKSFLTIFEIDELLMELEGQTTEEAQMAILQNAAEKCTGNDLKMIVRLIKGDLRINAGAKHILDGIHADAYQAFQTTRSIDAVLDQVLNNFDNKNNVNQGSLSIEAKLMTPVLPMLAQPCRSVIQAFSKCPNGLYAEIKYDGERVQVHKSGSEFKYFSRSLKPVMAHKVSHFKDYIPSAFPHGGSLILDSEILLINTKTGLPLPFGTLGKHKKGEFKDVNVCLFVFDCIHYNGINLMDRPIVERRKILQKEMCVVKNRVVLSEMKEVHDPKELQKMISRVLSQGLEGLVLKDLKSIYEPGKRHWLKVKKDYLEDGAMADSADLVVLGAWYGTGKKGGMMSVFLMGCYDPAIKKWCTVTKVHTGHDDAALERLQKELKMTKISQNFDLLPKWLKCSKSMTPDFIASNPEKSPVWEISGAEFTQNKIHSADGISIRFPRVTRERVDKDSNQATDLPQLQELFRISKEHVPITGLCSEGEESENEDNSIIQATEESITPSSFSSGGSSKSPGIRGSSSMKAKFSPTKNIEGSLRGESNSKVFKRKHQESVESPKKQIKEGSPSKKRKQGKFDSSSAKLHLNTSEGSTNSFKAPVKKPLPSVFEGVRLHIPEDTTDFTTLKKYFLAYGGELADEFNFSATHRIFSKNLKKKSKMEVLSPNWMWDSIKLLRLQPTTFYSI